MAKMFVRFQSNNTFTTGTITVDDKPIKYTEYYKDSIVFLNDTGLIWSNGKYYSAGVTTVSGISSRLSAVENRVSFATISDGTHSATATSSARTINFTGSGGIAASVSANGVTISGATILSAASAALTTANNAASSASTANSMLKAITSSNTVTVTKDSSGYPSTLDLKINSTSTKGNVTFSSDTNGLKGNVTIPFQSVSSNDNVLSLSSGVLSSTLSLVHDSTNKLIKLVGKNNTVISSFDTSAFIKDNMLKSVSYVNKTLTFTWNTTETTSGKNTTTISLSDLVDTYTGANLKLTAVTLPTTYTVPAKDDTVDAAVSKLAKGIAVNASDITSIKKDITNLTSGKVSTIVGDSSTYVRIAATVKNGVGTVSPLVDYVSSPDTDNDPAAAGTKHAYTDNGLATAAWVRDVALGWEEISDPT